MWGLGQESRTALHHAANGASVRTVEVLLAAGAQVNVQDESLRTPLHLVASNACAERCRVCPGLTEGVGRLGAAGDARGEDCADAAVSQGRP